MMLKPYFLHPGLTFMPHWQRLRQSGWLPSLLIIAASLLLVGCTNTSPPPGVQPVTAFDVERYAGKWYELARLDHSFERGMTDVSATYIAQPDGSIRVVNRGYHPTDQQWREAIGKALFTGARTTGSLKVSFFGPFYGGYHIAALDPNYRWALVLGSNTSYAWILARDKALSADTKAAVLRQATILGVKTEALIWVTHTRHDPNQP